MTTLVVILVALNTLFLLLVGGFVLYRLKGPGFAPTTSILSIKRYLSASLISLVLLYGIYSIRDLLYPFLIAFFLASLLDPVVTNLEKKGIPRVRGVAIIFACFFMCITIGFAFILPRAVAEIRDIVENYSTYQTSILKTADEQYDHFKKPLAVLKLTEKPSTWFSSTAVQTSITNILISVKNSMIGLASRLLWLVIIPLSLIFFLLDFQRIRYKFISFLPTRSRPNVDKISSDVVNIFSQYIRGLAKVCVMYGFAAMCLFFVLGLPYALFLGVAAGVLYAVPYVGPALAIGSAGIIALTSNNGTPTYALVVVGAFIVVHILFDYVITPRVVGGSVGLHPLLNVFALMVGATMFGIWGMLLAVPVAASIQTVILYFYPRYGVLPEIPNEADSSETSISAIIHKDATEPA